MKVTATVIEDGWRFKIGFQPERHLKVAEARDQIVYDMAKEMGLKKARSLGGVTYSVEGLEFSIGSPAFGEEDFERFVRMAKKELTAIKKVLDSAKTYAFEV